MFNVARRPEWHIAERFVTPESVFLNRRRFLAEFGLMTGAIGAALGSGLAADSPAISPAPGASAPALPANATGARRYPAPRNKEFNPSWTLTEAQVAATYNNFYEFSLAKDKVHLLAQRLVTSPWPVEVAGLVENPTTLDAAELAAQMPLEERVYRFRCVEAWAMIVPWTGFPLKLLLEKAKPKAEAKFVRFVTFDRPHQAPGMLDRTYPWPYTEGLRLDEAMHPLTLLATGIYGKPLPKQHGAPIRLVVPWKYGFKSIKSIVKIELVDKQPATLWETLMPEEYPFESNVDPAVPHPRWSQATERLIDSGDRVRTQIYNGYGASVANLYSKAKAR